MAWAKGAESWLDERGRKAWIVLMILAFIFAWPIGLGLLAYMIWSKRMFNRSSSCGPWGRHSHQHSSREDWEAMRENFRGMGKAFRPSGNAAFDAYKADTIRRLQDEQEAFEAFLQRLRDAKDKSEFDNFMEDRARTNAAAPVSPEAGDVAKPGEY
ncbi:MAG: DUF2852 domain-containing protein [bacterium]